MTRRGSLARSAIALGVWAGAAGCDPPPPVVATDAGRDGAIIEDSGIDGGVPVDAGRDTGGPTPDTGVDGGALPTVAPTSFERIAFGNFTSPTDAVVSPDGIRLYFAAFDTSHRPAVFSAVAFGTPGPGGVLHAGAPLEYPSGLVMSCDGTTIYIADPVADPDGTGQLGAVMSMSASAASVPSPISITGLTSPTALAMDADCTHLVISGRTATGVPAVLRAPIGGGAATVIASGGALRAPTGVFVDLTASVWVLDQRAEGANGPGVLFHIEGSAAPTEAASGLALGTPGGLAFPAGGRRAIVASRDGAGVPILTIVDAVSLDVTTAAFTGVALEDPGGLRSASAAGVFAIVDSEGAAIYRGQ